MKKYGILIILILTGFLVLNAQNVSQLNKGHKNAAGDKKIEILLKNAQIYLQKRKIKRSLDLSKEAYYQAQKSGNKNLEANALDIMANAHSYKKRYWMAIKYYKKELDLRIALKQDYLRATTLYNLASNYYQISDKEKKAMELYEEVLAYAKKKKYTDLVEKTYQTIIQAYTSKNKYKLAFNYLQDFFDYTKTNYIKRKINLLETQFEEHKKELSKKENRLNEIDSMLNILLIEKSTLVEETIIKGQEINKLAIDTVKKAEEIKIQKEEVKKREEWLIFAIIIIGVVLISTFLLILMYRQKKKANKLLALQNAEILEKNEKIKAQSEVILKRNAEIEKKNERIELQAIALAKQHELTLKQKQEIVDSIYYAKRIQQAVFPTKEYIKQSLKEYFILFKPRDIVSGDFYWMKKINNSVIVATADSTGHGVPGAFMSLLGISFLNEIVNSKSINNTGEILNRLRDKVKKSLHQMEVDSLSQDGMDIAFYIINTETLELQFSGAYNPLFIIRKNKEPELIEIKADRQPIAIFKKEKEFTTNHFQLQKGDCLYTFSDGYADQFGGKKGQKFKLKNFKQILLDVYDLPMNKQKQVLDDTLKNWMGNKYKQLDDILVLGVHVNF